MKPSTISRICLFFITLKSTYSYVLLTANIDDFREIIKKLVPDTIVEHLVDTISKKLTNDDPADGPHEDDKMETFHKRADDKEPNRNIGMSSMLKDLIHAIEIEETETTPITKKQSVSKSTGTRKSIQRARISYKRPIKKSAVKTKQKRVHGRAEYRDLKESSVYEEPAPNENTAEEEDVNESSVQSPKVSLKNVDHEINQIVDSPKLKNLSEVNIDKIVSAIKQRLRLKYKNVVFQNEPEELPPKRPNKYVDDVTEDNINTKPTPVEPKYYSRKQRPVNPMLKPEYQPVNTQKETIKLLAKSPNHNIKKKMLHQDQVILSNRERIKKLLAKRVVVKPNPKKISEDAQTLKNNARPKLGNSYRIQQKYVSLPIRQSSYSAPLKLQYNFNDAIDTKENVELPHGTYRIKQKILKPKELVQQNIPMMQEPEKAQFKQMEISNDSEEDYLKQAENAPQRVKKINITPAQEILINTTPAKDYEALDLNIKQRDSYEVYHAPPKDSSIFESVENNAQVGQNVDEEEDSEVIPQGAELDIKAQTESLWYDEKQAPAIEPIKEVQYLDKGSKKKTKIQYTTPVTRMPIRQAYSMVTPNVLKDMPVVAERYDFSEPLPDNDREAERLDFMGDPEVKVNQKFNFYVDKRR